MNGSKNVPMNAPKNHLRRVLCCTARGVRMLSLPLRSLAEHAKCHGPVLVQMWTVLADVGSYAVKKKPHQTASAPVKYFA